ncbi:MAG: Panacea domain-containing protein [Hyphomicrobiales bacterium]
MKLIWLSDRIHLNKFGRMVLQDNYYAMKNGPIPSRAMDLSRKSQEDLFEVSEYIITSLVESFDKRFFSKSDLDVMEQVWKDFGEKDGFILSEISHKFPEWTRFKNEIQEKGSRFSVELEDFFKCPDEFIKEYIYDSKVSEHSKGVFLTHKNIQSYLDS